MTEPQSRSQKIWRHIALGDVGSTNDYLRECAEQGDSGNLWVTAERQLKGRGRRGRTWVSERGNLYASVLLINPADIKALSVVPLLSALALYDALLKSGVPKGDLEIKWPNDLLFKGQKLAGILLENQNINGKMALIIGMGVNLSEAPDNTPYPAASLWAAGHKLQPLDVFSELNRAFDHWFTLWGGGQNAKALVDAWCERAKGIGEPIQVNLSDRSINGIFVDIDATGQLLLQLPDNRTISIPTGDVFFPSDQ